MKRFLRILRWTLVLQAFNFGITLILGIVVAVERLAEGRTRGCLAMLADIPLTFLGLMGSPIGVMRLLLFLVGVILFVRANRRVETSHV